MGGVTHYARGEATWCGVATRHVSDDIDRVDCLACLREVEVVHEHESWRCYAASRLRRLLCPPRRPRDSVRRERVQRPLSGIRGGARGRR